MAAVSEHTRVNFNPEWMGSTYSASAKAPPGGGGLATSPPFGSGGGNMNVYCGGSAANNADGNILAPPKLAKNRYGREEMLALFTGQATVAPAELKTTFPEFYIEQPQDPICMMPFTDVEERLLIQGGINSSKVINVVNHAERMRWTQGPPRSFGRGTEGGQSPESIPQQPPPFVGPRAAGYGGVGRGVGMPRGPFPPPGGFDQTRPPGRFGALGRGRGDGGRGRGFDRYAGGAPGGFGGPAPFAQGGVRFSEGSAPGQGTEEEWTPQNTRAQGLYDPNDPRDRPRQRQKSTSRPDDMDDPASANFTQPGQVRNAVSQRRSYTAPIGQAVPEWAMDDDEEMDENVVGTFDSSGQFQEADGGQAATPGSGDAAKKPATETKPEPKSVGSVTASSTTPSSESVKSASVTPTTAAPKPQQPSEATTADKGSKVVGRSIPIDALFSGQPAPKVDNPPGVPPVINTQQQQAFRDTTTSANAGPNQQGRRLPKAFAGLGQQEPTKLGANTASPDSSLDMNKLLGQQQTVPPYSVQQPQPARSDQQQNQQGQPKFVVPKTISSSPDEVFTHLHEEVESLVNSFSADDMPSVVRKKKGNNETIPQQQSHRVAPPPAAALGRSISASMTPQLERAESVNVNRNLIGQQWYYTDPQGGLRGPFESKQMAAWFAAGYFTMHLYVRRAEDTEFVPLGDLIKQCGRIPFMTSSSSSTADTPSPNPLSMVAAAGLTSDQSSTVIQPAARYGVAASMATSQNVPSNVLGALTNHTGSGAFHKTASAHALSTPSSAASGGLWDMELPGADTIGAKSEPVSADIQTQLTILNQMLQKEREEEMKRRAEEEERQRKIAEAREIARREEERQKAILKEKEEELRRIQESKAEAERRRREQEEEERRLREKKMLEEQQRRLEELAKKEAEEKRKRAAEEERLRKELAAKEAAEKKRREEEAKKAAAAAAELKQQQEELMRQEQKKRQQQKKAPAAPWGTQAKPSQQSRNGVQAGKDASQSLMEIQKEEERQLMAERRQEEELDAQRRQNLPAVNLQFGSAWGGPAATAKLTWEHQASMKHPGANTGPAWGGKGEVQQRVTSHGLWDDDEDDSPPASPQKSKPQQKANQGAKANAKGQAKASSPPVAISAKKEQNVKRIFQAQQSASDEFTNWCVKQVNGLSSDIDALTFVAFLKEVEAPSEVEDYVVSYFGDCGPARHFTKQFLEKRIALRKAASAAKNQADDLCTPAPALNPVKTSGGENVAPTSDKASGGGGANKKKKSGKSAGRFVVDGSILGFKAAADPNRLNAGEIDNPM